MKDPFEILGLEPRLDLDPRLLEARHRELSRTLHPDRYAGRPASERRLSLSKAIEVNEAFRRLRDPVSRAEALLARVGVTSDEKQTPAAEPEFLMEVMEKREALASAAQNKQTRDLERLQKEMEQQQAQVLERLAPLFERRLAAQRSASASLIQQDPNWETEVKRLLAQLRYYRRFVDEAEALADTMH